MKIHSSPISPFGSRITIALRAKGVACTDIGLPEAGLKSPEFLAVNPVGKIPVLLTEGGLAIPESAAILDYIEDRFPKPSLRPADLDERARINLIVRIVDTYVAAPIIRTFPHLDPSARNDAVLADAIAAWKNGMAVLAHFMSQPLPGAEAGVTLADCVLAPTLQLSKVMAPYVGLDTNPATAHPVLVSYYETINRNPIVGAVIAELDAAQAAM